MQDATVEMISLNRKQIVFSKCAKEKSSQGCTEGDLLVPALCFSGWLALATCHPIIHCMPMGHFMGGGTYVSAGAELVSVPDASDMEQRLSKGLAHLSGHRLQALLPFFSAC